VAGEGTHGGGGVRTRYGAYTIAKDERGQPVVLGRGGFSSVYLAHHTSVRGEFALKLLDPLPGNDRDSLTRFRRELDAAKRVNSQYVARVFEWQLDGEQPWIAMQ
jgi:serine/threonine protein kinase